MTQDKPKAATRRVWRISQNAPLGEWVQNVSLPAAPVPGPELPEVSYGSWTTSSYDLLDGTDVTEDPDTVPGELLDELFSASKPPKTPGR